MELKLIDLEFAICKIKDIKDINFDNKYLFISKTDEEISVVCDKQYVPKNIIGCDYGWNGFRIQGQLDFSLVGILSKIANILADSNISIFAISTYNTDYVLVKSKQILLAKEVLTNNGYSFV